MRPFLATIVLSLVLAGLLAKALTPDLVYDDLSCLAADPGSATTDDGDESGKPSPESGSATCKLVRARANFAKAFLVIIDLASLHLLMPVHALAVSDAATEPSLSDHFLPNAETGPPTGIVLGATTVSRLGWLLGTIGTVIRSCDLPRASLSHPEQSPPFVLAARRNLTISFAGRNAR